MSQPNPAKGDDMRNRLTKIGASLAAVAALAVGGSAIAGAAQKGAPPKPAASQSQESAGADTDNGQQSGQSAPHTGAASQQASEAASQAARGSAPGFGASECPGGYSRSDAHP